MQQISSKFALLFNLLLHIYQKAVESRVLYFAEKRDFIFSLHAILSILQYFEYHFGRNRFLGRFSSSDQQRL